MYIGQIDTPLSLFSNVIHEEEDDVFMVGLHDKWVEEQSNTWYNLRVMLTAYRTIYWLWPSDHKSYAVNWTLGDHFIQVVTVGIMFTYEEHCLKKKGTGVNEGK